MSCACPPQSDEWNNALARGGAEGKQERQRRQAWPNASKWKLWNADLLDFSIVLQGEPNKGICKFALQKVSAGDFLVSPQHGVQYHCT